TLSSTTLFRAFRSSRPAPASSYSLSLHDALPIFDLRAGQAVLARGGRREAYPPVRSQLVDGGAASDPLVLARAYRDLLDCDEWRSEEHTSELQSRGHLVCRLLLEKKKNRHNLTQA